MMRHLESTTHPDFIVDIIKGMNDPSNSCNIRFDKLWMAHHFAKTLRKLEDRLGPLSALVSATSPYINHTDPIRVLVKFTRQ